jgi:hypothetical protein
MGVFLAALGVFFLYTLFWVIALIRKFRVPKG